MASAVESQYSTEIRWEATGRTDINSLAELQVRDSWRQCNWHSGAILSSCDFPHARRTAEGGGGGRKTDGEDGQTHIFTTVAGETLRLDKQVHLPSVRDDHCESVFLFRRPSVFIQRLNWFAVQRPFACATTVNDFYSRSAALLFLTYIAKLGICKSNCCYCCCLH